MDVDWEATLTASEYEDHLVTPGQRSPVEIGISISQTDEMDIDKDKKRK